MRPLSLRVALSLLSMLCCAALVTLPARPAVADDAADADKAEKIRALDEEVAAAFAAKKYDAAAAKCREQIALDPTLDGPHYNLACALARSGKTKEALESLRTAIELGFTDAEHLVEDEDLASLHGEKAFDEAINAAKAAAAKAIEKAYEPGAELEGVRTVEGTPEKGLRWRLRLSKDATAAKPARLVVWLHPSGGSMNAKVEPLAAEFAKRGFALLVMTAKAWSGWSESDATKLLDATLPDVGKVEGVDARRPVLLGFSAGGQMAIVLWTKDPARFGGLVLDAAYPIDMKAYAAGARGPDAMLTLPEGDAKKGTPIFVLVGTADPGQMAWRASEEAWKDAGIPLTVTYVENGRHEWLFGPDEWKSLWTWLEPIAGAKAPPTKIEEPKPPVK